MKNKKGTMTCLLVDKPQKTSNFRIPGSIEPKYLYAEYFDRNDCGKYHVDKWLKKFPTCFLSITLFTLLPVPMMVLTLHDRSRANLKEELDRVRNVNLDYLRWHYEKRGLWKASSMGLVHLATRSGSGDVMSWSFGPADEAENTLRYHNPTFRPP